MKIKRSVFVLSGIVAVFLLVWLAEIVAANQIARRDFSSNPCWFVPEARPVLIPKLVAGPRGLYVPDPLRQINRRYVGLGLRDPAVRAPHFAVAALDGKGPPALWGWSYLNRDFWQLDMAQSRGAPGLAEFITEDAMLAACPDLIAPINPERLER
ncbi:hypothetical protein ACWGNA_26965 [Brucella cytisi]|uniref:hypothetical protein n=1 Tax=Brucella cytisi TaxID=407152 RepID=UPI0035E1F7EF